MEAVVWHGTLRGEHKAFKTRIQQYARMFVSCCISITGCLSPFKDTKLQVAVAGRVSSFGEKRRKGGKVNNYPAF